MYARACVCVCVFVCIHSECVDAYIRIHKEGRKTERSKAREKNKKYVNIKRAEAETDAERERQ